jgi:tetratricopeptide (TPR) repeat protein
MSMHICPSGHRWEAELDQETSCPVCTSLGGDLVPPAPKAAEPLPQLPGYEVLELIGHGGMGVVYKARQVALNRTVALKLIQAHLDAFGPRREEMRARFRTEAEAIARLSHPNVVQVYEVGEWRAGNDRPAVPYLALEYVGGGNLSDRLADGPLPPAAAARLVETLARAVQAAHDKGVVHRDLKPENVLLALSRERPERLAPELATGARLNEVVPKVTDFGLARLAGGQEAGLTASNAVVGTPSYMAPEQAQPGAVKVGPAADVWALGAILYACLTGRPPFLAATAIETLLQVTQDEPAPPARLNAKVPRDLENIALKCLTKDVAGRYASAAALADDLERYRLGRPVVARPVGAATRAVRWARRNPLPATLLVLLLGALTALVVTMAAGLAAVNTARLDEKRQRERAESRERQTRTLLGRVISRVTDDPRFRIVGVEPLREAMAADLLQQVEEYQQLVRADERADPTRLVMSDIWRGNLLVLAGRRQEALKILPRAAQCPDTVTHRSYFVASALECLANAQQESGLSDEALRTSEEICRMLEGATDDFGFEMVALPAAGAYSYRGVEMLRRGELALARKHLLRAGEVWDRWLENHRGPVDRAARLAVDVNLAAVALQEGALDEALLRYETARRKQAALVAENPGMRPFAVALSTTCHQLASVYIRLERKAEAQAVLDQARSVQSALLQASPDAQTFNRYTADHAVMVGRMRLKAGQVAKAQESFQEAAATLDELAKATKDPTLAAARFRADTYLGVVQMKALTQRSKSRATFAAALDRLKETAAEPGTTPTRDLGETAYLLAAGLRNLGEPGKAVPAAEQAVRWHRLALSRAPASRDVRLELNRSLYELAGSQRLLGRHADAAATCRERLALWPADADQLHDGACELCQCAALTKDEKQKQAYLDEALAVLKRAVAAGLKGAKQMTREGDFKPLFARPEFQQLVAEVAKRDRQ